MNRIITLALIVVGAISFLGCASTGGVDSAQKQIIINHGAKVAIAAAVERIVDNNPEYSNILNTTRNELVRLSWEESTATTEDVVTALRSVYAQNSYSAEQIEKTLIVLESGLAIYDEFMRVNNYEVAGQNTTLSALADGISLGLLADAIFVQPVNNPFEL